MSHWAYSVLLGALCYGIGAIPFGLLMARIFGGKDITRQGSGNIGATNVARVLGFWPAGFLTFVLDLGKGLIAAFVAGEAGRNWMTGIGIQGLPQMSPSFAWVAGLLAVLGHCYSPFLYFRGGKGVSTGFGVLLVLSPGAALGGIVAFGLAFVASRTGSLSSLAGLAVASVVHLVIEPTGNYLVAAGLMIGVVLIRHEANIDALIQNTEHHF